MAALAKAVKPEYEAIAARCSEYWFFLLFMIYPGNSSAIFKAFMVRAHRRLQLLPSLSLQPPEARTLESRVLSSAMSSRTR